MIEQGYVHDEDGEPAKRTLGHAVAKQWGGSADTKRATISRILNGKTSPQAETSRRLAKVLKQPPDFLLSEKAQMTLRGSGMARTIQRMVEAQEQGGDPSVYAAELADELEGMRRLLEAAEAALARLAPARKRGSR